MTKGIVVLKGLIKKRKLREICEKYDISYKFCHAVSEGNKNPSYEMMKKMQSFIPINFWFTETNEYFIQKIKESFKIE